MGPSEGRIAQWSLTVLLCTCAASQSRLLFSALNIWISFLTSISITASNQENRRRQKLALILLHLLADGFYYLPVKSSFRPGLSLTSYPVKVFFKMVMSHSGYSLKPDPSSTAKPKAVLRQYLKTQADIRVDDGWDFLEDASCCSCNHVAYMKKDSGLLLHL